jgi:hypothetical protein
MEICSSPKKLNRTTFSTDCSCFQPQRHNNLCFGHFDFNPIPHFSQSRIERGTWREGVFIKKEKKKKRRRTMTQEVMQSKSDKPN